MKEYEFIANEANGYRTFPACMEDDKTIVFHGTTEDVGRAIMKNGFKPSEGLGSVSFAKTSNDTLMYVVEKCGRDSNRGLERAGCILAVSVDLSKMRVEGPYVYLDPGAPEPKILGYSIVPKGHRHV